MHRVKICTEHTNIVCHLPDNNCTDIEAPTVDRLADQLWQYKENLSTSPSLWSCVSAAEELSQKLQQIRREYVLLLTYTGQHLSYQLSHGVSLSLFKGKGTVHGTLWLYLHDHGEDIWKWEGASISSLETCVCELQGKTEAKKGTFRKMTAPVAVEQFPRHRGRTDPTSDLALQLQELGNECSDQEQKGHASSQAEERHNQVYCMDSIVWDIGHTGV